MLSRAGADRAAVKSEGSTLRSRAGLGKLIGEPWGGSTGDRRNLLEKTEVWKGLCGSGGPDGSGESREI